MIPIVLVGACGRMGKAVEVAAAAAADLRIKGRIDRVAEPARAGGSRDTSAGYQGQPAEEATAVGVVGPEELPQMLAPGDVVIEFSDPAGCRQAAEACAERGAALVSGTTGLGASESAALEAAARRVAVVRAANFSLGVLALQSAVAAALDRVPDGWDVEIVERHHRRKADSPSGTALELARQVARRRGDSPPSLRHGRQGRGGPRPDGEIGIHAVRGGSWTGDHMVLLAGPGEWLEIRHVAQDRSAFAEGALAAARFVARVAPGLYTLEHVQDEARRTP